MLAEELVELHRQGNRPSIDDYVRSHGAGLLLRLLSID
jgi:hypothetical protein